MEIVGVFVARTLVFILTLLMTLQGQ